MREFWYVCIAERRRSRGVSARPETEWLMWAEPVPPEICDGWSPPCDEDDFDWDTWVFVPGEAIATEVMRHILTRARGHGSELRDLSGLALLCGGLETLDPLDSFVRALEEFGYTPAEYDPMADGELGPAMPLLGYALWLPIEENTLLPSGWWYGDPLPCSLEEAFASAPVGQA